MFSYNAVADRKRKMLQISVLLFCEPLFKSVHCPVLAPKTISER